MTEPTDELLSPAQPMPALSAAEQPMPALAAPAQPMPALAAPAQPMPALSAAEQPMPALAAGPPRPESPPTPQTTSGPPRPAGAARPGAINPGPIAYKGQPLDAERGPGLGCFRFQIVLLVILILATPLSVGRVPNVVSAILLFATIGLLLVSGQTIIFLLRLVSADRRGRRAPLAPRSPTVGQLEDAAGSTTPEGDDENAPPTTPVRQ